MSVSASSSILTVCKDAAGIAGNIFAFGLFVSPIPTFRRIVRNGSTEMFSGGAVFQFVYIILFVTYEEKNRKVRTVGLLLAVLGLFAIIVFGSLQIADRVTRRVFVGSLSVASLISMFASPLFIIKLVIRTKSVEFMPFFLSLSTFLMSASFFLYGLLNFDVFVYVPNGIGTILGIVQLALYFYYKDASREESREPLIVSYA
ncbi:bidirectional sugar transporter SWEET2-like isoform X2 [Neltuma alba]|uniref:bidirectional sugar transporter SWEET2-like isoform X2 n=1 Tax=Neltuma alba TaxID=207710 RepID=UPI0010A44A45|nr:bidirectional sugar transporter SWEET2-like isoform X2 [Prosopis alba]